MSIQNNNPENIRFEKEAESWLRNRLQEHPDFFLLCDSNTRQHCLPLFVQRYGEPAPEHLLEIWRSCIRMAKAAGCRIFAANLVPIDAEKYFRWISRDKDGDAILRWLGDVSMLYRWHEGYSDLLSAAFLEEEIPLVDLREPFLRSHRFKSLLCADGVHPTPDGYGLVDRAIARAVLA